MPKPAKTRFYKRKSFLILGVIVLLVVAGLVGYSIWKYENNKAIAADRARFEKAAQDVQLIADSIHSSLPPEQENIHKDCTYQSREWAPKPIVCRILYSSIYGTKNVHDANVVMQEYESLLAARNKILYTVSVSGNNAGLDVPAPQKSSVISTLYRDRSSGLTCNQTYELYYSLSPPTYNSNNKSTNSPLTLMTSLNCGGEANSLHYPLSD